MVLFLFALTRSGWAEKLKVTGMVLDAGGQPVPGASIADWWLANEAGRLRGGDAVSDAAGRFSLEMNLSTRGVALMAVDAKQESGGLVHLTPETAARPLTIRLTPMVTVRGEYFCAELNEHPGWCNTMLEFTTNRLRLVECRSDVGRFEIKVPPGEYRLDGYDGTMVFGTNRTLTLTADRPVHDLGRILLRATPTALSWGKPSPLWNITEARGIPSDAMVKHFRGRWLLLDFWGYWCGPCIQAMPDLFQLYDEHAADREAFEIIAVHNGAQTLKEMDQRLTGTIRGLWKGRTLPFPVIVDSGETTFENFGIRSYPTELLIDPDGRVVRDGGKALLKSVLEHRGSATFPFSSSPDQSWMAEGREDGTVRLHPSDQSPFTSLAAGPAAVNCTSFAPDGRRLATGSRDGAIRVWQVPEGKEILRLNGHRGPVFAVTFSPDGQSLASAGFDTTRVWDLGARAERSAFTNRLYPGWSVAYSGDGRKLAIGGAGSILVRDAATGREELTCQRSGANLQHAVAFSPDGQWLVSGGPGAALLWDATTGKLARKFERVPSAVVQVRFGADGRTVTALTRGKVVRSWVASDGTAHAGAPLLEAKQMRTWAEKLPDDPESLADEAWHLALSPGLPTNDCQRAMALAQRAVQLAPPYLAAHRALGGTLYRSGRLAEAVKALEQAKRLEKPDEVKPWELPLTDVFLGLAHHGLGQTELTRAVTVGFWGRWWDEDRDESRLFQEFNALLFGPHAADLRLLVLAQVRNGIPPARVSASLDAHPGLDPAQRAAARRMLPLASAIWEVEKLQKRIVLRDRVIQAVAGSKDITAEWQGAALSLARKTAENESVLNSAAWDTVVQSGLPAADYELALAQAEAAYRLNPDDAVRNTLGVALYRVGRHKDAIEKLGESESNNPEKIAAASDLPFLAMAYQRSGKPIEARKRFDQWIEILRKQGAPRGEELDFLRETETVLGVKAPAELSPP